MRRRFEKARVQDGPLDARKRALLVLDLRNSLRNHAFLEALSGR